MNKHPFLSIIFILLFMGLAPLVKAQYYFKALVKDSVSGEALIDAIVIEQGTTNGASADANGVVRIKVLRSGDITFTIKCMGYELKTISVTLPQKDSIITLLLVATGKELEEVTVASVRTNNRIENIPTRVEVLGLEEMNEENGVKPGNIMSLLGDIAGIQMQQVSASSGNTMARIQGLNGRYTQLLKDGMPLFGGLSGSFGIMQIPPLDLKQIEIIKGSASTLYGGDAIGGIINLVSKEPGYKREISATANQTSLRETNLNCYISQRFKKYGFTFFAGQTFQKLGDIDNDSLSDVPLVNSTVLHPKWIFYFNPKATLTINYSITLDQRKGGDMRNFATATNDTLYYVRNHMKRNNADIKYLYEFSNARTLTVKLSGSAVNQGMSTNAYSFDATQWLYYSEIAYVQKLKKADWVYGMNFNGDIFENQTKTLSAIKDYRYQTTGLYVQNTWIPTKRLTVESGFRTDFHSHYGVFPLPRLSLMYKFNPVWTGRINGGYGYKIPNPITYLNIETDLNKVAADAILKSEKSQGLNADINYHRIFAQKFDLTVNQSLFYTNISQPVYDSAITPGKVALVNASKALQTKGLQTYVRIKYTEFEWYIGYVFTDIKKLYDASNTTLTVTPKHNFSSTLFYEPVEEWRVGIESSYIAGQVDQEYQPVKNYLLFAAMIQYNIGKFSMVLNGENLLDFRQSRYGRIYDNTLYAPVFHQLWAPIDGRVINFSVKWKG